MKVGLLLHITSNIELYTSHSFDAAKLRIGRLYLSKKFGELFFARVINFLTHSI